jgi:hypothetical protein
MSKLSILKGRGEIHIYKGATCLIQLWTTIQIKGI